MNLTAEQLVNALTSLASTEMRGAIEALPPQSIQEAEDLAGLLLEMNELVPKHNIWKFSPETMTAFVEKESWKKSPHYAALMAHKWDGDPSPSARLDSRYQDHLMEHGRLLRLVQETS